jgi:hypothetical protein
MAQRKSGSGPGTAKKPTARAKPKARRAGTTRATSPDRSFAKVLQSKSVDTIMPEVANRLEAGRRLYAREGLAAAKMELAILSKERERLIEAGDSGDTGQRIDRLIAAVENDIGSGRALLDEMKQAIAPQPGGWSVMGRVTLRDGTAPAEAAIVFLAANHEPVKELRSLKPDANGLVRQVYPATVVKRVQARNIELFVALQIGDRIVATDPFAFKLMPGALHQFDLRVNTGLD